MPPKGSFDIKPNLCQHTGNIPLTAFDKYHSFKELIEIPLKV
jgi:hypothetical protein